MSAANWKARLARIPTRLKAAVEAELEKEVASMTVAMRLKVGARSKTGKLRRSIRYEKSGEMRFTVRAGGEETKTASRLLRRLVRRLTGRRASKAYDYAMSEEFGTAHKEARPFFYPTYRSRKKAINKAMKAAIKRSVS